MKNKMFIISTIFFAIVFIAPLNTGDAKNENLIVPQSSSDIDLSTTCGDANCHKRIYSEWKGSMHSQSSPEKDPLVKAFYDYLSKEKYDTLKCDICHSPIRSVYPKENNTGLFGEGVACVFCHSIRGRVEGGGLGINYYKLDFINARTGPPGGSQNIHGMDSLAIFKSVDICAGCHQFGETDFAVSESKSLCQQCHMPSKQKEKTAETGDVKDKVFQHLFEGGHSEIILGMAAILGGTAIKEGNKTVVKVSIENSSLHHIPIGFPLRSIYLKVTALDIGKKQIWTNYKKSARKEDPKSYFALLYPEEEEPYVHCVKEIKPVRDTRLEPQSEKEISYEIPSGDAVSVKVELYYRLLPDSVLGKLNIAPALAEEVLMSEEVLKVKEKK